MHSFPAAGTIFPTFRSEFPRRTLGIAAVLAKSPARIFYRNALNLGLPVLRFPHAQEVLDGDDVEVDLVRSVVVDHSNGKRFPFEPIPPFLMELLRDGGLIPHLHRRLHGA